MPVAMSMDRRQFNRFAAGVMASGFVLGPRMAVADNLKDWLLTPVPGGAGLRQQEVTGPLSAITVQALWKLFERIGVLWDMRSNTTIDQEDLRMITSLKAEESPSYLTEYREAARILEFSTANLDSEDRALDLLVATQLNDPNPKKSRLGRLRRHVVGELMTLQVSFGGFRRFGYMNYRGHIAGPFSDPDNLPYRGISG